MAGTYGYFNKGTNGGISSGDEEFDEEDVWALVKTETSPKLRKSSKDSSSVLTPRGLPTATRMMIPRGSNSTNEGKVFQQSAPVNIPDWSKIYMKNSRKGSNSSHGCYNDDDNEDDDVIADEDDDEENDIDDNGNVGKIPPHEWIAKKLARSQISSFSVCEGAGRTLKGRDLSKVRNAVLTRTGFLE